MGHQTVPLISHHPDSSHIGFNGSRTNGMAVAAQNTPPNFVASR